MNNPILFKKIISSKKDIEPEIETKKEINLAENIAIMQMSKYKNMYSHNKDSTNNIVGSTNFNSINQTNQTNQAKTQPKTRQVKIDEQQNSRLVDVENAFAQQYYKIIHIEDLINQQNTRLSNVENKVDNQNTRLSNVESQVEKQNEIFTNTVASRDLSITSLEPIVVDTPSEEIQQAKPQTEELIQANNEPSTDKLVQANNETPTEEQQNSTTNSQETNTELSNVVSNNNRLEIIETTLDEHKNKMYEINKTSCEINEKLKSVESSLNYVKNLNLNILTKIKNSCSQICFVIDNINYIGMGWFYYEHQLELKHGFFITSAHCVMEIKKSIYYKASSVYIMNPINNNWTLIDTNNIFIDGVGDIALIKTGINLSEHSNYCLKLANDNPMTSDICYIVGNYENSDENLITMGCVCNPNYCDTTGFQITDLLYVSCPGLGGQTGGPIVNLNGDVIGIYSFGLGGEIENYGTGPNRDTLYKSLQILKSHQNNKQKRFLGLDWIVPTPFVIKEYYEQNQTFKSCVYINGISSDSPFYKILDIGDLLLSAVLPSGDIVEFGNSNNQKSPGILLYYYDTVKIQINYIKKNQKRIKTDTIYLEASYDDVSNFFDGPLQTGLLERRNNKITNIMKKMQKL